MLYLRQNTRCQSHIIPLEKFTQYLQMCELNWYSIYYRKGKYVLFCCSFLHDDIIMCVTFCGSWWSLTDRRIRGTLTSPVCSYILCTIQIFFLVVLKVKVFSLWKTDNLLLTSSCFASLVPTLCFLLCLCFLKKKKCFNDTERRTTIIFLIFQPIENASTAYDSGFVRPGTYLEP